MAGPIARLYATLGLDSREFDAGLGKAQKSASGFGKGTDLAIGAAAGAITAGLLSTISAAREWETAFIGVRKTVDTTGMSIERETEAFAKLEDQLLDLSEATGVTSTELAGIAETGGAMGIAIEDIESFTKTVALLSRTTDVTSEAAAASLGKIGAVIGMTADEFDNFGNTLVGLGNAGSSTEQQILEVANRMSGTASTIGLSAAEMLGWSSAMADVGINAEAAGSTFQRFADKVTTATLLGTSKLADFAKVAGMTSAQFQELYSQSSSRAILAVVQGLSELSEAERLVVQQSLQLSGSVLIKDLLAKLTGNVDGLTKSLDSAGELWEENAAMTDEWGNVLGTVDNQVARFWASVNRLSITLGETFMPSITMLAEHGINAVKMLGDLAKAFPEVTNVVVPLVTALSGLVAVKFGANFLGLGGAFDAVGTKAASAFSSTFFPGLASQSGLAKMKALGLGWGKVLGLGMAATIIVILGDELSKMADKIKTQFATIQGANVAEQISKGALSLEEMNAQLATLEKSLVDVRVQQFTFGPLWNVADFFGVFPSQAELEAEINAQRAAIQAEVDRIARGERGIEADTGARATLFGAMAEGAHADADELIDEMDRVAAEMGTIEGTAPDLAGPIDEEFAAARKAIKAGFGSIKEALKKESRPQLISRADRIENMEERQKRVTRQLHAAVEADDPWNIAYWTRAAAKQQTQLDAMRGKGRTTTNDVSRDFAGMGLDIQGTMFDIVGHAETAADGVKAAFGSADMTTVGLAMMQGVAAGITQGAPLVSGAAAAAANGARLAAGAGTTGGVGGTTLNINGNVYGGKAGTRQLQGELEKAVRPTQRNRRHNNLAEG